MQGYGYEKEEQLGVYQEVQDLRGVEHYLQKVLSIRKSREEEE